MEDQWCCYWLLIEGETDSGMGVSSLRLRVFLLLLILHLAQILGQISLICPLCTEAGEQT